MSNKVFIRNKGVKSFGSPNLAILMRKSRTEGDIGIEIECEGINFKKGGLPDPWKYEEDHSLRGDDNAEYVFKRPIPFDEVEPAIRGLFKMFDDNDTVLDDSNRTSVHVHLNAQPFYLNRLASFCALYFSVEEILTHWCGDHRVGNLFCMTAKNAPYIVTRIRDFIKSDGEKELKDNFHYSGLNVHALTKFGSIEVRAMRGVADPETILTWVSILRRIYELSAEYKDPREICGQFSKDGPSAFFDHILGVNGSTIKADTGFTNEQIRDAMYDGIRLAQSICYCRDWDKFEESDISSDPFGRRSVKFTNISDMPDVPTSPYPPITGSSLGGVFNSPEYQASLNTFLAQTYPAIGPEPSIQFVNEYWVPTPEPEYDIGDEFL